MADTSSMTWMIPGVAALVLSLAGSAQADEPAWVDAPDAAVRMEIYEPFSPFERSVFEWKVRGRSPLLTMSRRHLADAGAEGELTLVSAARFIELLERLDVCTTSADAPAAPPEATGERRWVWISIRRGDQTEYALFDGGAGAACEQAIRAPVEEVLSFGPWRNPYLVEGEYGMLRTETDRPSRVWINGVDTGEVTPVLDYPLSPGRHEIRWVAVSDGRERTESVTVEAGRTTTLNVTLEGLEPPNR